MNLHSKTHWIVLAYVLSVLLMKHPVTLVHNPLPQLIRVIDKQFPSLLVSGCQQVMHRRILIGYHSKTRDTSMIVLNRILRVV